MVYTEVTVILAVIGPVVEFVAVKLGIFPVPDAARPIQYYHSSMCRIFDLQGALFGNF